MEESKRQQQIGQLIQEELTKIFQAEGFNIVNGGMVSISKVQVTPDLLESRVYLSFFKVANVPSLLNEIRSKTAHLRGLLGNKLRFDLRRIPTLQFFEDDTLEHVFKMEELFKKVKEDSEALNRELGKGTTDNNESAS